jgi:hypothetical protein
VLDVHYFLRGWGRVLGRRNNRLRGHSRPLGHDAEVGSGTGQTH